MQLGFFKLLWTLLKPWVCRTTFVPFSPISEVLTVPYLRQKTIVSASEIQEFIKICEYQFLISVTGFYLHNTSIWSRWKQKKQQQKQT